MNRETENEQSDAKTSDPAGDNVNNGFKESEIPLPQKKSDVITDDTKLTSEKEKSESVIENGVQDKAIPQKDKRGNEIEKQKHEENAAPKIKETTWPQKKMNEANNQSGDKDLTASPGKNNKSDKSVNNIKSNSVNKEFSKPL